ncbi:MAG TPA: PAS domain S-box protein [Verrucomicrobiota bacterium]|nr:PAS domain S-box protein [Verrucomicrobiota bacterium]
MTAPIHAAPENVLIIHSFGRDFAPFDAFSAGFRTELIRQSSTPVDIYEVSLESARFDDDESEKPFVDYILALSARRHPDLVLTVGGPAARFAQKQRKHLFPDAPMLFAAVDHRHVQHSTLDTNSAVVSVRNDPQRVVEHILRILPDTTNVVVVIGNSPLEQFWLGELREVLAAYTNRVAFSWLNDLSLPEIRAHCARLPSRSAIFFAIMSVDAAGVPHIEQRALAHIHETTSAPIFGIHDTQLGRGIVGGPLMNIDKLSRNTATIAARLLKGEDPSAFRPPPQEPGPPVYDWRELSRWNISESRLPPGSIIKFREPTLWDRYQSRIIAILCIVVAETLLIVGLLINLARRRKAEQSLADSRNRLHSILNTAAEGIITLDEHDIIRSTNAAAERIFGYNAAELIGQNVNALLASRFSNEHNPPSAHDLHDGNHSNNGQGREVIARRKDASTFPAELTVSETSLADGRVRSLFVRDITERKLAEQSAREFGGRFLQAKEPERARLARELHDDITQRLARLAIDAGRAESGVHRDKQSETMRELRDGLVRLSEDVHSLSYRLHPALLEDLGLADALKSECERFSRREFIEVNVQIEPIPAGIARDAGLCLFRVTQEALRNVARHARATSATVSLRRLDDGLQLAVSDTGCGFDARQQRQKASLGLASMRERVRLLAGELDIETSPGHGTTILAWIPLNKTDGKPPNHHASTL